MKINRLFLVFVVAWLTVTYIPLIEGTLLLAVAEAKRHFLEVFKPLSFPVSNIDRSPVPGTVVKESMTFYPPALEHAPDLPSAPVGNRWIGSDSF